MRIFKTRWFHKWAKKEKLTDSALRKACRKTVARRDVDLGQCLQEARRASWPRKKWQPTNYYCLPI